MTIARTAAVIVALAVTAGAAPGQVRYSLAAGPLRIDRLAGTPVVPSVGVHWSPGRRGVAGGRLALVRNAGFYGLNALSMDLDFGVRSRPGRVDWQTTAGPWLLLGGDGDGTPYALIAGQATGGVTWWARPHLGFLGLASLRVKLGESTERATGSGALGVVVR